MSPNPYKFIGFGDIEAPKPYRFIGFRWARTSQDTGSSAEIGSAPGIVDVGSLPRQRGATQALKSARLGSARLCMAALWLGEKIS